MIFAVLYIYIYWYKGNSETCKRRSHWMFEASNVHIQIYADPLVGFALKRIISSSSPVGRRK